MSGPYYQDEYVTLYHGDALAILATLPNESVDLVATDPPYNVSDKNGRDGTTPGTLKRKDGTARKIWKDFGAWDRDWKPAPFLAESKRLLRNGGALISFTSEYCIADYLDSGLRHRGLIFWRKTNPTPAFRQLYVRSVEIAVWQVKEGASWVFNAGGYRPDCFEIASVSGDERVHPNQKPFALIHALLCLHSDAGSLVLDPYAGSGTTLVAAKASARRAIGIEQNEAHCETIALRLSQNVLDLGGAA